MRFRFRLEKVLRVRRIEEEQEREVFLARQRDLHDAKARLEKLQHERREVAQFGYGQRDLHIRTAMYNYLEHIDKKIDQQRQVVLDCQNRLSLAREAWLNARQKKELLEKLKEKRFSEWVQDEQRAEQKLLDDMGNRARA